MADLWGGRFTKATNKLVFDFNASIGFDKKLLHQDIQGSIAHVTMLARQGILTDAEKEQIIVGLQSILADVDSGALQVDESAEDVHSFVEATLIKRVGDVGKKLHTGRSRNDQVALDMRLYTREQLSEVRDLLRGLMRVILAKMEEHVETYMPGFTHLQKAQPTTLAHHLGAYFEMFRRDEDRLKDILARMNYCPLGAGAMAGTTYPLDRHYSAELMGFAGPTLNSMDSVADRDYLVESLAAFSLIMMHLSRFSEEMILWNSNEYQFIELDDTFATGSSIMPQKKNPDVAELVRGKTGRVYGSLMALLTVMKGLPLAYNKDMQEDKENFFDALETVKTCIYLFGEMLESTKFHKERMAESAMNGFSNATDAADYLVNKGIPFRDAHGIIGRLVLYCIEKDTAIHELSLAELQSICPAFEKDVYDVISLKACVERRSIVGAPGPEAMRDVIRLEKEYLEAKA